MSEREGERERSHGEQGIDADAREKQRARDGYRRTP